MERKNRRKANNLSFFKWRISMEKVERLLRIMLRDKIKEMNREGVPAELKDIYIQGFTDCMEKVTETLKKEVKYV